MLTLHGFDRIYKIIHHHRFPNWLLGEQAKSDIEEARCAALLGYHFLAKSACERRVFVYNLIPKHHKLDKLLRRMNRTGVSASLYWTFCLESEMGLAAKVIGRCHGASSMRRGVQRWLLVFWDHLNTLRGQ